MAFVPSNTGLYLKRNPVFDSETSIKALTLLQGAGVIYFKLTTNLEE